MNNFSFLFLALLAISVSIHSWLATRQVAHLAKTRGKLPEMFEGKVALATHQKAADYTTAGTRFGLFSRYLSTLLLLLWTLGGGIDLLDYFWRDSIQNPVIAGTLMIISVFLIGAVLDLPLDAWKQFRMEEKFGFNNMTPGLFFGDFFKNLLVLMLLGAPLCFGILWVMETLPLWWFWAWVLWLSFVLIVTWTYPVLIAPLFNKFAPLDDQVLMDRIHGLLSRVGFSGKGVQVMDGSKRSSHSNAYFTGFGKNKRVVLFDTLLKSLTHSELEAVLAHELGHFKCHHIRKQLLLTSVMALAGFFVLSWAMEQSWFFYGLGVTEPSPQTALLLFLFASPAFTFFLQPLMTRSSRKHEFEADRFAAEHASGEDLGKALVKLTEDNASTLTPDPLHSAYYDSHPPVIARITRLQVAQTA